MQTPSDLKSYRAPDAFQLIEPFHAGYALLTLVILAMILEPVLR